MALLTCNDARGNTALFGFPSNRKYPIIRTQPIMLYVNPYGANKGRILYAVLPFAITQDQLAHYFPTNSEASNYSVYTRGTRTLIVRDGGRGQLPDIGRTFFCPMQDFSFAMARAVRMSIDHQTAYQDLPYPFEGGLENLEASALRDQVNWAKPVFDTQGVGDPLWIFHMDKMRVKLGVGPLMSESVVRNRVFQHNKQIKVDESVLTIDEEHRLMSPEQLAHSIGVSQYIAVPFDMTDDFDPGDPPIPLDQVIGKDFASSKGRWKITHMLPPARWGQGWSCAAQHEDGSYSSINQRQLLVLAKSGWMAPSKVSWTEGFDVRFCAHLAMSRSLPKKVRLCVWHQGRSWYRFYRVVKDGEDQRMVFVRSVDQVGYDRMKAMRKRRKIEHKRRRAQAASLEQSRRQAKRSKSTNRLQKLRRLKKRPKETPEQVEKGSFQQVQASQKASTKRDFLAKRRRMKRAKVRDSAREGPND